MNDDSVRIAKTELWVLTVLVTALAAVLVGTLSSI
jgi:hypothetical protein